MRFLSAITAVAMVVGLAAAAPLEGELEKRQCTGSCVDICCQSHGNCNYFNCAGSYCTYVPGTSHAYCECVCKYG